MYARFSLSVLFNCCVLGHQSRFINTLPSAAINKPETAGLLSKQDLLIGARTRNGYKPPIPSTYASTPSKF